MGMLFKVTELEVRVPLNINVLDAQGIPRVMSLKDVLQAYIDQRRVVITKRSEYQLAKLTRERELLNGYQLVYLNIDEVIHIIRENEHPKEVLMQRFLLTELQAESILNMRLRSLRKLEELEIKKQLEELAERIEALNSLLSDTVQLDAKIVKELVELKKTFGRDKIFGPRRTLITYSSGLTLLPKLELMVAREPITLIYSEKGWIRSVKGHSINLDTMKFKDDDRAYLTLACYTTDRLLMFATNGRSYSMSASDLPSGKGYGEPIRLFIDLGPEDNLINCFAADPSTNPTFLVVATDGRGFVVLENDLLAQTRKGKQILNLPKGRVAGHCHKLRGTHVAMVGSNRKMLVFPITDIPVLSRGRGVILQRFKGAYVSDIQSLDLTEGLAWSHGEALRRKKDLEAWLGRRGEAGRFSPPGFPRDNKFGL